MKLLLLMAYTWAQEQGAEHAAEHGITIPWNNIFVQAFNLALLVALLTWVLRDSLRNHFRERAENYRELVDRAEHAAKEAEKGHQLIKDRLATLEATSAQGVARARSDAEELRSRMLQEAKELTQKLQQEAQRSAQVELEKAKTELRKELLEKALTTSRENLKNSLGTNEQKKLQNEFAQKIEVVGG